MMLELYYREECPYSKKVRGFIAEKGLKSKIKFHDVDADEDSLRDLEALNHDEQVPCLVVDGEPMLESDEIIEWLDVHTNDLKQ